MYCYIYSLICETRVLNDTPKLIISVHSDTSGVLVARTLYMVCGTSTVTVVVILV